MLVDEHALTVVAIHHSLVLWPFAYSYSLLPVILIERDLETEEFESD